MSSTLDEAIARLQDLRTKVPGDTPILVGTIHSNQPYGDSLRVPSFGIAHKAKNKNRIVSVRGVPFIFVTDY